MNDKLPLKKAKSAKKSSQSEMELMDQVNQLTDALKRSQADFINFRNRVENDQEKFIKYANSSMLEGIIPLYDQLLMALHNIPPDLENNTWTEGVTQIGKLFQKQLNDLGVVKIQSVGEKYHPEFHEAVMRGEGPQKDIILEEFEPGYMYHDRVLKPAKVKVCTDVVSNS